MVIPGRAAKVRGSLGDRLFKVAASQQPQSCLQSGCKCFLAILFILDCLTHIRVLRHMLMYQFLHFVVAQNNH